VTQQQQQSDINDLTNPRKYRARRHHRHRPTVVLRTLSCNKKLVQLQDASGNAVELTDEYSISGTSITQPLPALDDGAYTLNWRVVSEDGHPISGSIGFTVGEAALGNNEATSGGQFQNEQVDPDSVNLPTDDADSGTNPWLVGIMSFVGVLVIGGAAALMVMRMRRGNQPGGGSDSGSSNDGGAAGGR
jgi:hypothetical protein